MDKIINIVLIVIALIGFAYSFYSQVQARKHICKEKISKLDDTSIITSGVMPPKEILNETGLKHHKGFNIGAAIFIACIILLSVSNYLSGSS